jgi:hypothetical protein
MTARHCQWRVCFLYIQNAQRLSISLARGLDEMRHCQWRVSLFLWNASLSVTRCHSYIWNFTVFTLIFNNINLIITILNKKLLFRVRVLRFLGRVQPFEVTPTSGLLEFKSFRVLHPMKYLPHQNPPHKFYMTQISKLPIIINSTQLLPTSSDEVAAQHVRRIHTRPLIGLGFELQKILDITNPDVLGYLILKLHTKYLNLHHKSYVI